MHAQSTYIRVCMRAKSLQLGLTLCDPMDGSQILLSMGFSRQ